MSDEFIDGAAETDAADSVAAESPGSPASEGSPEGAAGAQLADSGPTRDSSGRFAPRRTYPGIMPEDGDDPAPAPSPRKALDSVLRPIPPQPGQKNGGLADPSQSPVAQTAAKFNFGGVEFDSQEAAEQQFRSLRGMFKDREQLPQLVEQWQSSATQERERGQQWMQYAQQLEQQLAAAQSGSAGPAAPGQPAAKSPQPAQPAGPASVKDLIGRLDWDQYRALIDQYEDPRVGTYYLLDSALNGLNSMWEQRFNSTVEPLQNLHGQVQGANRALAVMDQVAQLHLPGGNGQESMPAFPELRDATTANQIVEIWNQLGFTEDVKYTPNAVMTAIYQYRGMYGPPSVSPAAAPQAPAANPAAAALTQALQAGMGTPNAGDVLSSNGPPAVRPATTAESNGLGALKHLFRSGNHPQYSELGVER